MTKNLVVLNDNNEVCLSGHITEEFELPPEVFQLENPVFNCESILSLNSHGIRTFINSISNLKKSPIYKNCPQPLVMQFNMIAEFFGEGSTVESFQVPFFCFTCHKLNVVTFYLGKDYTADHPPNLDSVKCLSESCDMVPEIIPEMYLSFISRLPK